MKNTEPNWLFLDFDGVLCDSLEECLRSSWLALSRVAIGPATPPEPPFDAEYRRAFLGCRPFVRSGEDYLVLHSLVQQGRGPRSQAEFDLELGRLGRPALDGLKTRLYQVREEMLNRHRSLWLSWNPLFAGIREVLQSLEAHPRAWILSTKKASFIQEILSYQGIVWPIERIQYSGSESKLGFVESLTNGGPSLLVDDQIDHLNFHHPTCLCALALWGYVDPVSSSAAPSIVTSVDFPDLDSSWVS